MPVAQLQLQLRLLPSPVRGASAGYSSKNGAAAAPSVCGSSSSGIHKAKSCTAGGDMTAAVARTLDAVGTGVVRGPLLQLTSSRPPLSILGCGMLLPVSSQGYEGSVPVPLKRRRKEAKWVFQSFSTEQSQETSAEENKLPAATFEDPDTSGPPVLTIIAGFVVMALVIWTLTSVVSWLAGLIFR